MPFRSRFQSIRGSVITSYGVIILLMMVPMGIILFNSVRLSTQYNRIIYNVNYASTLKEVIASEINSTAWDVVAGKKSFEEAGFETVIEKINSRLVFLGENASSKENERAAVVIRRTVETMSLYIRRLGEQIENNMTVSENEEILEEILGVSSLVLDLVQDFVLEEIQNASLLNRALQNNQKNALMAAILTLALVILYAARMIYQLTQSIEKPVFKLEHFAAEVSKGNFDEELEDSDLKELAALTESLNVMSKKLEKLIQDNINDQQNLKRAEMQALQAQIMPHFLYNTFDSIIWLAEEKRNQEVIDVTRAFAGFFRLSLNKGKDFITVSEEKAYINSYLTIQKVRYRDILQYEIDIDEKMADYPMLKLLLQPIVENALYHGLKNKRGRGAIFVSGRLRGEFLYFEVSDTGIGMPPEKVEELLVSIEPNDSAESGYGLYNVNQRLQLYYGKRHRLKIKSQPGAGTTVSFDIPYGGGNKIV